MIHTFSGLGLHLALDVESGAVHILDDTAYALIPHITPDATDAFPEAAGSPDAARLSAWNELRSLQKEGVLLSDPVTTEQRPKPQLKAMCLHVSHDCDLRCGYCFAGTGAYGMARQVMPAEVACRAIDLLIRESGARVNLEIDFFGGEPLLAMDTVKQTVAYARAREKEFGKRFRFTLTTNGLALDDETTDYINREMDNVVLSMDGRPETNNALRKTTSGQGSFEAVFPKIKRLVEKRTGQHYVRGTFTARNPEFVDDLLFLADQGFKALSMEPVVLAPGHPLALTVAHMDSIEAAYDRLMETLARRHDFSFFHFNVDLSQGPCVYKRLRGCGAGTEYAAVTPEGDLYPCHQFVGRDEFRMGHVDDDRFTPSERFESCRVETNEDCRNCWAKFYCGGGCAAGNLTANGDIHNNYQLGCRLERKRTECALLLAAKHALGKAAASTE